MLIVNLLFVFLKYIYLDWASLDKHHPVWRVQTSLSPSDSIDLNNSDLVVEIFKWVGEEFGIVVDDETSCPKQKTNEKPPISPPKVKRSHNSTRSLRSSMLVVDEKDEMRKEGTMEMMEIKGDGENGESE